MIRAFERQARSLTLRLTVTFGLLGFGLVGVVAMVVDTSVHGALGAQIDRELSSTAKVLLHRLDEDHEAPDREMLDLGDHLSLRILDSEGRILLASPRMETSAPPNAFPVSEGTWAWRSMRRPNGRTLRLLALETRSTRLHLARDTTDEVWMLQRLRRTLLWVGLLAPLGAAVLGFLLIRMGLGPLAQVARMVGAVRPETLATRLEAGDLPTELESVAKSVNGALARLESGFARLTQLNSDLAHELRSPVHALRLEVERLLGGERLPQELQESMAHMLEALDHLASVIEQMLFLSRFEDPTQGLDLRPVPVGALLTRAVAPFEYLAEEQEVVLKLEPLDAVIPRGDEVLLRRALHNLITNALRVAPRGSTLRINARREGADIILEVVDAGPGMPAEAVAQIGRRFLRLDASRSSRTGGTGLGLAIVQGIAKAHGGSLEVDSADPGCVMRIKVPGT